ncbi:MAG: CCC motif membrane protein [Leeuwenhoekiella sp.]
MEQQKLPNSTLVLVFGILAILGTCCYGVPGFIFAILAIVLGNKAIKIYNENPDLYTDVSNAKTGKILGIVALVLSTIAIIGIIAVIAFIGWDAIQDPTLMQERMEEIQSQQ